METTITLDGRELKLRATAAVPRLYRIKFGRDIIQDMKAVQKALEGQKEGQESTLPLEALVMFENMAYCMAKHADKDAVPDSVEAWLDSFSVFSIYSIFPVLQALWENNMAALADAKKKANL